MLFNSFAYLLFFPLVCVAYFIIPHKYRWIYLLIASYYFYMNWQPIYALLIFTSTVITYTAAYQLALTDKVSKKKLLLYSSLFVNFGILFVFKYYGFFNAAVFDALGFMGIRMKLPDFDLLLPVGISFYTFQAVGYTIDVYRGNIVPEKHFGRYALFVSFFPQLVAGPIERASNLLPQFSRVMVFDYQKAVSGMKLIIWGYFMKVVVADRLAIYVNAVYNNPEHHEGATFMVATVFFAFQIYCDFGGYSNIAIGCAKIMGFDLMTNFKRPYFAKTTTEFWRRWHISLSTWFKDYVYIPLGGSKVGTVRNYYNLFLTFLVSGLWHGANWTFVIWGALNGVYQIANKAIGIKSVKASNSLFSNVRTLARIATTFVLICFSWIFFRANSLSDALTIIRKMTFMEGSFFVGETSSFLFGILAIGILVFKDYIDERNIAVQLRSNSVIQYLTYSSIVILILLIGVFDGSQFIYFQF